MLKSSLLNQPLRCARAMMLINSAPAPTKGESTGCWLWIERKIRGNREIMKEMHARLAQLNALSAAVGAE